VRPAEGRVVQKFVDPVPQLVPTHDIGRPARRLHFSPDE
jgi:hypothetical protein